MYRGARSVIARLDGEQVVELRDGEEEPDLLARIAEHRRLADRDTCLQTERLRRGQATFQLLRGPHPSSFGTELSHHRLVRPLVLRPRITPGVLLSGGSTPRRRSVAAAPPRKASLVPAAPRLCGVVTYG